MPSGFKDLFTYGYDDIDEFEFTDEKAATLRRCHPGFPFSLEDIIMTYHRGHSNSFRLAHTLGCGSDFDGDDDNNDEDAAAEHAVPFPSRFAKYFRHVHVSDPDPVVLARVRRRLGAWYATNWWKGKFTFSQTGIEEAAVCAADGTVDLVAIVMNDALAKGATDVDAVVRGAATSLARHGTLAVVAYNPVCRMTGEGFGLQPLVKPLFELWGREGLATDAEGMARRNAGLDYVGLPDGLFNKEKAKKLRINHYARGPWPWIVPGITSRAAPTVHPAPWGDEWKSYDPPGLGWTRKVGPGWHRRLFARLLSKDGFRAQEKVFKEVDKKIQEKPGGTVQVEWAVVVLLGTRK